MQGPSLVRVSAMGPNPGWRMMGQRHTHSELIVIYRGAETVRTRDVSMTATAGDILLYPKGLVHDEISDPRNPVETVCIAFRGGSGTSLVRLTDDGGRIRMIARWLVDTNFLTYAGKNRLRAAYLTAIIEECERLRLVPKESELVRTVRAFIYNNMTRRISIGMLAAEANMNKFYFVHRYKALTGTTPMADVWSIRLSEARTLVIGTTLALRTVSGMAGFANEYHFAKRFKSHFGVTPGSLRKRGIKERMIRT